MNVGRRALLTGGILGAVGWSFYGLFGRELRPYESDVRVRNNQSLSVDIELTLSNLDEHKTILNQSFTLAPGEDFQREGVLADNTQYRMQVRANQDIADEEFKTCCRGFLVQVLVEQDSLGIQSTHID